VVGRLCIVESKKKGVLVNSLGIIKVFLWNHRGQSTKSQCSRSAAVIRTDGRHTGHCCATAFNERQRSVLFNDTVYC
jgi:hypothetical protein